MRPKKTQTNSASKWCAKPSTAASGRAAFIENHSFNGRVEHCGRCFAVLVVAALVVVALVVVLAVVIDCAGGGGGLWPLGANRGCQETQTDGNIARETLACQWPLSRVASSSTRAVQPQSAKTSAHKISADHCDSTCWPARSPDSPPHEFPCAQFCSESYDLNIQSCKCSPGYECESSKIRDQICRLQGTGSTAAGLSRSIPSQPSQ